MLPFALRIIVQTDACTLQEMTTPPILVLDNGAYSIKAGFAGVDEEPRSYPNSIARSRGEKRVYVADEIDNCRDLSGIVYRRPFERVGRHCNREADTTNSSLRVCW